MKKLAYTVLLICLIIGVIYAYPVNSSFAKEMHMGDMLNHAYEATQADPTGYYVHDWSVVNASFVGMEELMTMAKQVNTVLQIPNPQEYKSQIGKQNVYQLHGKWGADTDVSLIFNSMNLEEHPAQTTMVIKIEREGRNVKDITQSIEKVKKSAAKISVTPQISTCIKGFMDDRIKPTDRDQLIKRVFSSVHANEIEGIRSDLLTSVSGYSPLTKEHIMTNEKKMNLQIVVQWDEYQKRTLVLVGSPIVTIEY